MCWSGGLHDLYMKMCAVFINSLQHFYFQLYKSLRWEVLVGRRGETLVLEANVGKGRWGLRNLLLFSNALFSDDAYLGNIPYYKDSIFNFIIITHSLLQGFMANFVFYYQCTHTCCHHDGERVSHDRLQQIQLAEVNTLDTRCLPATKQRFQVKYAFHNSRCSGSPLSRWG